MKKILYCFTLNTYITTALLHRLAYRKDSYAVFMCDKLMFESRGVAEAVKKLKDNSIIDDLILDVLLIRYDLHISMEEYSSYIERVYDDVFFRAGYSVDDFDEIYCINDIWGYYPNIYLNIKQIYYYHLSAGIGDYCTDLLDGYGEVISYDSEEFLRLSHYYNAISPLAKYAIPIILKDDLQNIHKLSGKKYHVWDKAYALDVIKSNDIDNIVTSFEIEEDVIEYADYININSWGATSWNGYKLYSEIGKSLGDDFLNVNEMHYEYIKIISDYYSSPNKKIVIKSHPAEYIDTNNLITNLGNEYSSAGNINFEFLQKYYHNHCIVFDCIIGAVSTSLENVDKSVFKKVKILGKSFLETWYYYNAIYAVVMCLANKNIHVKCSNDIESQIKLLSNQRNLTIDSTSIELYELNDFSENDVILINALQLEKYHINISDIIRHLGNFTNIVFFNINYTKLFFEKDIQSRLLYLDIIKEFYNYGYQGFAKPEMVWFYCGTYDFYKKILNFSLSEDMPRQNFLLNAKMKVPDKIVLNSMFNIPAQFAKNSHEYKDMQEWLVNEKDIHKYISRIKLLAKGSLLIIAINEGIPKNFDKKVLDDLRKMGFNNIPSVPGYSYIGIMCDGKINYNKKGSVVGQPVVCNGNVDNLKMEVISSAGKTNNKAVIKINDYDYAINDKGINLFILDLNDRKILESVAINAEADRISFNRKRKNK